MCGCLSLPQCPSLGTWPTTQARALTGNWTGNPLVHSLPSIHWATPARAENDFLWYYCLTYVCSGLRRVLVAEWVFKLLYCSAMRGVLSNIREMRQNTFLQAFMTLHNKDAVLKGNRLMVQRKGNLPEAGNRSSKEKTRKIRMLWLTQAGSGFPQPFQPWGIFLLTQLRELGEVSLNQSHHLKPIRGPNLVEKKPLPGRAIPFVKNSSGSRARRASPLDIIRHILHFLHWIGLTGKTQILLIGITLLKWLT